MHFLDFECGNCVIQWRYIAGNNWGMCDDGTGAVGCGPQEEFRACSDVSIGKYWATHFCSLKTEITFFFFLSDCEKFDKYLIKVVVFRELKL